MPGIVGIIRNNSGNRNQILLDSMVGCMLHDPSYSNGYYINHDMGVYIGWVSHAGSFSDCLPVYNENKNIVLIFSGEEFTDNETKIRLKTLGHEFDPSNGSYLIHLYEENSKDFFRNLNGWFNGILIDIRNKDIIIFVDRFGMQRMYYHEKEDQFYFSSEAKSLLKILPELRRLDSESLGQYFACGSVLENRSIISGISLLPGGSLWRFRAGKCLAKENYFLASEWEDQEILEKSSFYERLGGVIRGIIPRYFDSIRPIGMSLTGGIDTRIIMAYSCENHKKLPCYTFGGMNRECYDVKIARRVAEACQQDYKILPLGEIFLSKFQEQAEKTVYITDGVLDVCGSHEIYLNRLAREIAPIRMTGIFGSEVLRSVDYTKVDLPVLKLFDPEFEKHTVNAENIFNNLNKDSPYTYVIFKLIPWILVGRVLAAQSQLTVRTPFMDNDLIKLMYQAPNDVRNDKDFSLHLILEGNPELSKIPTDRGLKANGFINLSILARIYYEFLFKAEYYYGQGMPNWLSKAEKHLKPNKLQGWIVGRHKIDNYRLWFKNELSKYIRMVLLDGRSKNRSYLNKKSIDDIVNSHISGERNYTKEINKLLTVELIQRTLLENH